MGTVARRFRRGQTLVVLSTDVGPLIARDFALDVERSLSPRDACVLAALDGWTTVAEVGRASGLSAAVASSVLQKLHRAKLIEASDEPELERRRLLRQWRPWNPEAGLFHFGTRSRNPVAPEVAERRLDELLALGFAPPSRRRARRGRCVALPMPRRDSAFARVLLGRRTWRRFAPDALSLQDLATLLGLTWGVQKWARLTTDFDVPLKTSPSGGGCHPLEVYVASQNVDGLPRGLYRYDPDVHELIAVRDTLPAKGIEPWLRQAAFTPCAAAFFVTAVWSRTRWKYRFPRAYRVVLLEAGHVVQTLCLLATSLDLAPFSTAAFDDARLERALKIDGVNESVLYVGGVGARPAGMKWAPWPSGAITPATYAPASGKRGSR